VQQIQTLAVKITCVSGDRKKIDARIVVKA